MQQPIEIEGFTPDMLWTFAKVCVGLAALVILVYKVIDIARKEHDRKQLKERGPQNVLADEISKKIMAALEPRFQEIDRKLSTDKLRLDEHAQKMALLGAKQDMVEMGQKAICKGMMAMLDHEISGDSIETLRQARKDINNYLIDK